MNAAADFRKRLDPEWTVADLDKRADNAAVICLQALADDNAELAQKAFDRMTERWQEREQLTPAPAWLWRRRFDQVESIVTAADLDTPLLDTALWQWHYTTARTSGEGHALATVWAGQRMNNAKALAMEARP